eukprot:497553-Heterocapsa_arctica.AAC.1
MHACPLDYAQHVPLQPVGPGVRVCAVNGESIKVIGVRTVRILLWGIQPADVTFHVMAISRPLLSVGLLRQMCFDLHLGKRCFLQKGKKQTALVQRGPLFYLPALTIGDMPDAKMTRMTTDARTSM